MIEQTTIDAAKQTDLVALIGQGIKLKKISRGEYEGPCPKCGGTDRLHVKPTGFFCRQCHPEWGDAIEYMQWAKNLPFADAVGHLTGYGVIQPVAVKMKPVAKVPAQQTQAPDWTAKVMPMVTQAQDLIEDGADYLQGRGLALITGFAFGLGYRPDAPLPGTWDAKRRHSIAPPQPAIVMPWYRAGEVVAVRYRFLKTHEYQDVDGKARKVKQSSVYDSDFTGVLYGGHVLPAFCTMPLDANGKCAEALRTLVLCEGEMNAMSIWQAAHGWKWDILSLGSESQKPSPAAMAFAGRYGRVIIWMDKGSIAKQLMSQIPGSFAVNSPVAEGKALDANDLLQSGQLAEFLAEVRWRSCRSDEERERVKWYFAEVA